MSEEIRIGEEEIIECLQEAINLNLVEIVGITPDGSWLYSATDECRKLLVENISFGALAEALANIKKETGK